MFATFLRTTAGIGRPTTFCRNASLWAAARYPSTRAGGMQTRFGVRYVSTEIEDAIKKAIASSKVVLFMKGTPEFPQCGFSRATIQMLGQQGVDPQKFAAYNVLEDDELRQGIKDYSQWPTIPQLYVNQEFIGGCDIVMSMAQSGELAELLEKNDCLVPEEEEVEETHIKPAERK